MPTSDIIGYLWHNRQALDLYSVADVLDMVADLQRTGLDVVRLTDMRVLSVPTGVSVQLTRLDNEEWDKLVPAAIVDAAVRLTVAMNEELDEHR